MQRYLSTLISLCCAAALLAGCAAPAPTQAPTAGPTAGLIRIYSSMPRHGFSQGQTAALVNAIKLRLAEDNYQACNGQVRIDYQDLDDATPAKGSWDEATETANANKAVSDPDAMVYIGPFNSGAAKFSMRILNTANLIMISPANGYVGLTQPFAPGEPDKYFPSDKRNYVRLVTPDDVQAEALAKWAKELNVHNVYILDDYQAEGKGIADLFERDAKQQGIAVLAHEGIDTKAMDYRALMFKIKSLNPDLIFFGGLVENNAGQVVKDMRAVGMTDDQGQVHRDGRYSDPDLHRRGGRGCG